MKEKEIKNSKFVIVLDSFLFGGAERQAVYLARYIKYEIGANVIFLVLNGKLSVSLIDHLNKYQIDHYDLEFRFSSSHFSRIFNLILLASKIRKHNPDIIIPFTIRPNVNVNAIWQLTRAKLCLWNQRDLGHGFSFNRRDKIFLWSLKNTKGIISNSNEGIRLLREFKQTTKKAQKIIFNGLEEGREIVREKLLRNTIIFHEKRLVITMVANLTKYKDHITLLSIWKEILSESKYKERPLLILAGQKADTYETLLKFVKINNLEMDVKFTGAIKDVSKLLNESDIGVLSSLKEGMSNSVLEYMMSGLPVLASNIESNRECLGNDYNFLYKANDHSDFKTKLLTLIQMNDKERKNLGKRNKSRVKQKFSINKMGLQYIEFIKSYV